VRIGSSNDRYGTILSAQSRRKPGAAPDLMARAVAASPRPTESVLGFESSSALSRWFNRLDQFRHPYNNCAGILTPYFDYFCDHIYAPHVAVVASETPINPAVLLRGRLMKITSTRSIGAIGASVCASLVLGTFLGVFAVTSVAQSNSMTFFLTSVNPGKGADFGGLAGADRYCQSLAAAAGANGKTWRAYLSAAADGATPAVNAKDRIGKGPWHNVKGVVVAANVDELHGANNLNKQTALTEKGEIISGRGDAVNQHDILTGSTADGLLAPPASAGGESTCGNWTKSGEGSAFVGHHDRVGLNESAPMKSWNASHPTRGCGLDALKSTGGAGLFYCFAAN
jgi:hypothetical protein